MLDKPAQRSRGNRSAPSAIHRATPTTGREGQGKTDKAVKDQPTTTGKSRQNLFTDAFFAFRRDKTDKPADDQSMTTTKPQPLFSSDIAASKTAKTEPAQKRAGSDRSSIASQVDLEDLDKQQRLILMPGLENTLKRYTEAANNGDSYAQYRLGMLFEHGDGCVKSNATAFQWFFKSAQQGFSTAQYVVGDWYEKGCDVVQDVSKAVEWFTKAAEQGHVTAQLRLGWLYGNGKGVPKDDVKALIWYLKAAGQGDKRGQTLVVEACEHGRGTPKSNRLALQWYIEVAETGGEHGQRKVAEFYRDGRCGSGNPRWDRLAKKWYDAVSVQDKGFKAQRETISARKEQIYTPPEPSYANNNSSKDGYEFSSNEPYYPPQPTQSFRTYGSQYVYPPPVQPMYANNSQPTDPYAPQPAQRVWPHQLDRPFPLQAQPAYLRQLDLPLSPHSQYSTNMNPFSDPFGSPSPFGP